MKQALTIAGSDSGGGAGIQADLKAFHALGVFGCSVVTAVTAQNTIAVKDAHDVPQSVIRAQLDAIFDDFEIAATKTGMLSSSDTIKTVSESLRSRRTEALVVDPVMISKSGFRLLKDEAIATLTSALLPLATLVTPNIHEAELLSSREIQSTHDLIDAAKAIHDFGCGNVLIKGGHASFDPATDVLYDGRTTTRFEGQLIETPNTHGTGCTFSAAITARLALGDSINDAIANAKHYITQAIARAEKIGGGHGPTAHFYFLDTEDYRKRS